MAEHEFTLGMSVVRRLAALAVALVVCGTVLTGVAQDQGQDDLARLRAEFSRLHGQGKYPEAVPIAQRYVELARQKHGEEHSEFAKAIADLPKRDRPRARAGRPQALRLRERIIALSMV